MCRLGAGKIDLQNVAALRSDIARAAFLVGALEVGVGDFDPLRLLARDQRYDHHFAVFRSAEHDLALVEIFRELLRRRRRNVAGVRAVEQHVFDGALLVLIALGRRDQRLRRIQSGSDRAGELDA